MRGVDHKTLVLTMDQFMLLHRIILAYPDGLYVSPLDQDLGSLEDLKFIMAKGFRFIPTEAGIEHVMPRRQLAS